MIHLSRYIIIIIIIIMSFTVHVCIKQMMSYDSKWLDSTEGPIASSARGLKLQLHLFKSYNES